MAATYENSALHSTAGPLNAYLAGNMLREETLVKPRHKTEDIFET
jgi:hypothetical protein